jgi:hypothetical protein
MNNRERTTRLRPCVEKDLYRVFLSLLFIPAVGFVGNFHICYTFIDIFGKSKRLNYET